MAHPWLMRPPGKVWGSLVEHETRARIFLSVWAYGYEIADRPMVDDYTFDRLAEKIDPQTGTGNLLLDDFFASHFSPMTGMWIHQHPELDKVKATYERYYATAGTSRR